MNYFLQQLINSLGWGSLNAMMAAGYTMTFGLIGLVNFAHGEVMMVGAMAAFMVTVVWELPFWAGCLSAIAGSIVIGLIIERIAFKPLRGAGMITLFITSLAASFGIRTLFIMLLTDKLKKFSPEVFHNTLAPVPGGFKGVEGLVIPLEEALLGGPFLVGDVDFNLTPLADPIQASDALFQLLGFLGQIEENELMGALEISPFGADGG